MKKRTISVVVPCYNEEDVIAKTWERIKKVMSDNAYRDHEIIFVNDGSVDRTLSILRGIAKKDKRVRIVSFSRNFGHEAASTAGIHHATGDIAFLIDADLQDPPELFPEMIRIYEETGCNVVYGVRDRREGETAFKRFTSAAFYRFFNFLSEVKFPVDTGDFRLIDKKVIDAFRAFKEKNKYVRGLLTWVGFKQMPFHYRREQRQGGVTKYNYWRLMVLAFDIIFAFSKRPMKLATNLGGMCLAVGLGLVIYVFVSKYTSPLPGWASTLIIIIFFGGVQLLTLGIVGEYIGIIFDEVKGRPEYVVDERVNFGLKIQD